MVNGGREWSLQDSGEDFSRAQTSRTVSWLFHNTNRSFPNIEALLEEALTDLYEFCARKRRKHTYRRWTPVRTCRTTSPAVEPTCVEVWGGHATLDADEAFRVGNIRTRQRVSFFECARLRASRQVEPLAARRVLGVESHAAQPGRAW